MILTLALLLAQAAPAPAKPQCTAIDAALPADLAGWTKPGTAIDPGKAVEMPTMDPATIRLVGVPLPARPGRMAVQTITIATEGTYGIALDQPGWIDVYAAPKPPEGAIVQSSTTHGHGPDCSSIRKIVRYRLSPGTYQLVLSALQRPVAKVMLVKG